jgi:tRNA-specific 2-thiouridylase
MRIVVAMSGGVDSSVVAGLLAAEGHEVIGVTLQLYDHGAAAGRKGACCAGQDIHDASRVADRLGIAHYVIDAEQRFKSSVISAFADSYAAGQTPVPCIACNQHLKFGDLLEMARDLGAEALATGHYVRRVEGKNGPELHQAADSARDQSWFLFARHVPPTSDSSERIEWLAMVCLARRRSARRRHATRRALVRDRGVDRTDQD